MPPTTFIPQNKSHVVRAGAKKREFPRIGAWALFTDPETPEVRGRLGIIFEIHENNEICELHLTDEKGDTIAIGHEVPLKSVRQATLEEIPIPRRPHDAKAHLLGYLPTITTFPRVGAHTTVDGYPEQIGIILDLPTDGATVKWVDEHGNTTGVDGKIPLTALHQCAHDEIPEPNQVGEALAVKLGYLPEPPTEAPAAE